MNMLTFPEQLSRLRDVIYTQADQLQAVASVYADALAAGGVIHVYANGHSRISVEEMVVRMGALTGFHPVLQVGLTSFTDVVGVNGIRVNQTLERVEGLGAALLEEFDVAPGEPLLVISATGQTQAAVDMARAWVARYPRNPLVVICSVAQSDSAPPKHTSGMNLTHVARTAGRGFVLDNGMPVGDMSVRVAVGDDELPICPLSSIGALSLVQSLNELTVRELVRRGVRPCVLRNMHLADTRKTYGEWMEDQRRRYARTVFNPELRGPAAQ